MVPESNPRTVVLIVDDAPENLAVLSDALDEAGYMVLVAVSGDSALERLDHVTPDIILLDAMMPGLDGFETCRRIKTRTGMEHVPVVFMTGLTDTEHIVTGFMAGGVDYVTKPIEISEVLARMTTHLRNARLLRHATRPVDSDAVKVSYGLTQREAEVLEWVTKGKTNRDIADILGMSPRTVDKHLEHVFVKLGVETRTAAVAVATGAARGGGTLASEPG